MLARCGLTTMLCSHSICRSVERMRSLALSACRHSISCRKAHLRCCCTCIPEIACSNESKLPDEGVTEGDGEQRRRMLRIQASGSKSLPKVGPGLACSLPSKPSCSCACRVQQCLQQCHPSHGSPAACCAQGCWRWLLSRIHKQALSRVRVRASHQLAHSGSCCTLTHRPFPVQSPSSQITLRQCDPQQCLH